nr:uncharacterized protein LOC129273247 [Lytechinus pictus]
MEMCSWDLFEGKGLDLSELIGKSNCCYSRTLPSSPCSPPQPQQSPQSPQFSWPPVTPSRTVSSPPPVPSSSSPSPHGMYGKEFIFSYSPDDTALSTSQERKKYLNTYCVFCKNNKETLSFYSSHVLKDDVGKVICPVLRAYTCPICGANGDNAHTIKYCPMESDKFRSRTTSVSRWSDSSSP